MSDSYFEVQVEQATENALVSDLAARHIEATTALKLYHESVKRVAAVRADQGKHISRRTGDDLETITNLLDRTLEEIQ